MIPEDMKKWIDEATYEQLLRRWRFAPSGDSIFQGETGSYYVKRMTVLRLQVGHDVAVQASKDIGW